MDQEHGSSGTQSRAIPGRGALRRIALVGLVALPLLLTAGSGSASASCTYNLGSDQSIESFSFRSHWSDFGGYGAWDLGTGQSQCWYDHGWDSGWFGPPDCWLDCDGYPSLIDADPQGWVDICSLSDSQSPPQWAYRVYAAGGTATAYGQSPQGYPPGCTGALGSSGASPSRASGPTEGSAERRPVNTDSSFFTGRAPSRKVRSITFHLHSPGGKALGSLCMPPVSVSHADLSLARRKGIASVYVGIVKQARRCGHPKVAGPERAGRPRPDVRFASFCQDTSGRVVRTYRYPDDFTRPKRPSCRSKSG
jgi:hypothetical protein